MPYFLTSFLHPIEVPISISMEVPITFDNPRNNYEIQNIKNILIEHLKKQEWFKKKSNFSSMKEDLKKSFSKIETDIYTDSAYVIKFFKDYKDEKFFEFISKMWVILRYEDDKESQASDNYIRTVTEPMGIDTNSDPSKSYGNKEDTLNYCILLSFLSQEIKDYETSNNIIFEHELMPFKEISDRTLIYLWFFWLYRWGNIKESAINNWKLFPLGLNTINENSKKLDSLIKQIGKERTLYIGNLLLLSNNIHTKDDKIKILLLTSLLELLLTHNPVFNRYNVEDSISKQFQLKGSILIHLNNKANNLLDLKKKLNSIYDIRSSVIHGNFEEIKDIKVWSQKKRNKIKDFYPYTDYKGIITDLYTFIKAILEEYIKNPSLINFIKDN